MKPHIYKVREKVLVQDEKANKYEDQYKCPYKMNKIYKMVL